MENEQPKHPVWAILEKQGRTLVWLARKTGYSQSHVWNVKSGQWPASRRFRARCAEALDIPETVLFIGTADVEDDVAVTADAS